MNSALAPAHRFTDYDLSIMKTSNSPNHPWAGWLLEPETRLGTRQPLPPVIQTERAEDAVSFSGNNIVTNEKWPAHIRIAVL